MHALYSQIQTEFFSEKMQGQLYTLNTCVFLMYLSIASTTFSPFVEPSYYFNTSTTNIIGISLSGHCLQVSLQLKENEGLLREGCVYLGYISH